MVTYGEGLCECMHSRERAEGIVVHALLCRIWKAGALVCGYLSKSVHVSVIDLLQDKFGIMRQIKFLWKIRIRAFLLKDWLTTSYRVGTQWLRRINPVQRLEG